MFDGLEVIYMNIFVLVNGEEEEVYYLCLFLGLDVGLFYYEIYSYVYGAWRWIFG